MGIRKKGGKKVLDKNIYLVSEGFESTSRDNTVSGAYTLFVCCWLFVVIWGMDKSSLTYWRALWSQIRNFRGHLTLSLQKVANQKCPVFPKSGRTDPDDFSDSALPWSFLCVSFIVHSMYLKSTEHTLCIYFDFVLRSEWSLINIPGTMGVGPNNILVVKGLKLLMMYMQSSQSQNEGFFPVHPSYSYSPVNATQENKDFI